MEILGIWESESEWEKQVTAKILESLPDGRKYEFERLMEDYSMLRKAVHEVYYAAHWMPERPCDAIALWGHLRDCAKFEPGNSPKILEGADINLLARAVADAVILYRQHRIGRQPFKALVEAYQKATGSEHDTKP